jgi:(1->4)-alpha-D-glucan 1-alpha-D-glucosylmutase
VYRSYVADDGIGEADRKAIKQAIRRAKRHNPALPGAIFDFIRDTLLLEPPRPGAAGEALRDEQRRFAGKFQQVTSPVMAKGVEDTAFYVYNRLLSLNEVGGDPERFGLAPAALHRAFAERRERWPRAMSATSTHDTKRSEDVRARLNVLSELPGEWRTAVERWAELNRPHKVATEDGTAPDANEEYFLYQTLVGAWPIEPYSDADYAEFVGRIQAYVNKAFHEAKVHTSWINPEAEYDESVKQFVGLILNPEASGPFLDDFRAFQRRVNHYGLFGALAQALVKITAPGVPDTYQGTELWDFSLVDPDNRRSVDYGRRRELLAALDARQDLAALADELTATKNDGRIKLAVTARALRCRRDHPGLFCESEYVPVEAAGAHADHVFAFLRRQGGVRALTVVPRLLTGLIGEDRAPCGWDVWPDTFLPLGDAGPWHNIFTGETLEGRLAVADVLGHVPVALLLAK